MRVLVHNDHPATRLLPELCLLLERGLACLHAQDGVPHHGQNVIRVVDVVRFSERRAVEHVVFGILVNDLLESN